jgi:alpha-L-fucosidase
MKLLNPVLIGLGLLAAFQSAVAAVPGTTRGIIDLSKLERPADAVTLVGPDGYNLIPEGAASTKWVFADGILTASPAWDSLVTKERYRDFRMHVEFNVNEVKDAKDPEANGNSGIYIQNRYEIQIHNSFGVPEAGYTASHCGSIYRRKKPDRLVCKPAGEWQSFDIVFRAARFDGGGKKTENARITVYQNGALIHDDYSIPGKTGAGEKEGPEPRPIKLQGHHNPVRFRNVWIQKLALDAEEAKPAARDAANVSAAKQADAQPGKPLPLVRSATTKDPLPAMQEDFLKLKFGMFIHFNLETFKGVQWVSGYHNPADFNPGGKVDTDAWADAAVSAGMKYAVLTAKHVSGFCLWDSQFTTYDVMNPACPYQQDLVAQFIQSFKSRGLKVGLYYCWRHPGFKAEFKVLPPECDPATHSVQEQIAFQKQQIAELLKKYPDVFYLWNDALDPKILPADEALAFIRGIRPDVLVSANWWDWARKGTPYADIAVKEMRHFPETNTAPGETCWELEQGWFWKEGTRPKTARQAVALLTTANGRNSNFLLNVGPDKQGRFEEASIQVLREIGTLWRPNANSDPRK